MQRTITANDLQSKIKKQDAITLLDVRRAEDRDAEPAIIPGAKRCDPAQVEDWCAELEPSQDIILYCVRGGSVSNSVLDALLEKGLKARFIDGGIEAWKNAGGTIES